MIKKIIFVLLCFVSISPAAQAQAIDEKGVPANIRSVAEDHLGEDPVSLWVLDRNRDKYVATVLIETRFRTVEISLSGKWIATTDALPEAKVLQVVKQTIQEKYATRGFEISNISNYQFVRDSSGTSFYSAEMTSDDQDLYVTFNSKGQVLREEER